MTNQKFNDSVYNEAIKQVYVKNLTTGRYKCMLKIGTVECSSEQAIRHKGNALSHLKNKHSDQFLAICEAIANEKDRAFKKITSFTPNNTKMPKSLVSERITFDPKDLTRSLLSIFVDSSAPFILTECPGFRFFTDFFFKTPGNVLNRKTLGNLISTEAANLKQRIIKSLKNKQLSLKIDGTTKHRRHYVCINAQYVENGVLHIQNLIIKKLTTSGTGTTIKNALIDAINEFEINFDQIVAVAVDNARAMIRGIAEFDLSSKRSQRGTIIDSILFKNEDSDDTASFNSSLDDISEECAGALLFEDNAFESFEQSIPMSPFKNIITMPCIAHSFQLAIEDFFSCIRPSSENNNDLVFSFTRIRDIVITLRTPSESTKLESKKLIIPRLDNETRWFSFYLMLHDILCLKGYIEEVAKTDTFYWIDEETWEELRKIVESLNLGYSFNLKLQSASFLISDLFFNYYLLINSMQSLSSNKYATKLLSCVSARCDSHVNSDVVLAGVYMDPRFKEGLTNVQSVKAISCLTSMINRIVEDECVFTNNSSASLPVEKSNECELSPEEAFYESAFLNKNNINSSGTDLPLIERIANLKLESSCGVKENALQYWHRNFKKTDQLLTLSQIIFSIPVTQVSVERAFSDLSHVYSSRRSKMSTKKLKDILFLRINRRFASSE